jgi:phage baseplate assembly protein W
MKTNSISFPRMFDVARNTVGVIEDNISIVSRVRLLILTEPTELYDNPNFGVGLRRHLWQYNNESQYALIQDRIKAQLELHEPCVDAEKTTFAPGLLFTGSDDDIEGREFDQIRMTIGLKTIYNDQVDVDLSSDLSNIDLSTGGINNEA